MGRYLAGIGSALLLVLAGFFVWQSLARRGIAPLPPAPFHIASAAAGAPAAVLPDPPQASEKTREEKRFSRYDHDRNGAVSREEFLAARRKAFAKLDANHDGVLSFDEYAVKTEERFAKADADRSGVLTPAEFGTTRIVRKTKPRCPPARRGAAPALESEDESGQG